MDARSPGNPLESRFPVARRERRRQAANVDSHAVNVQEKIVEGGLRFFSFGLRCMTQAEPRVLDRVRQLPQIQ